MSYISPNSDIHILKGVPLDRSYNHTLYQSSIDTQFNKLYAFKKYTLNNYSYQRATKNSIRVGILSDNLYDCNYLMFRNTSYGNKWFYAFIDSIEYINDNASKIIYTIDVMQTWYFDYELGNCYVEREHTETDNVGDNLIPENIDVGDLIPMNQESFTYPGAVSSWGDIMYNYVIFYVPNNTKKYITRYTADENGYFTYYAENVKDTAGHYQTGTLVNGIYSGCTYFAIPMDITPTKVNITKANITKLIQVILGDDIGGTIVNACQAPKGLWDDWIASQTGTLPERNKLFNEGTLFYNTTKTNSYTPKNKKMYCAPYRKIIVSNNAGQTATYNWEYFATTPTTTNKKQAYFVIDGAPIPQPEIMCFPRLYRNIDKDYESGIVLNDFPTPPWSEDSFSKWWTQNKDSYNASIISGAISLFGSTLLSFATGGSAAPLLAGATLKGVNNIIQGLSTYTTAQNTPDQLGGQAFVSSLRTSQKRIGFYFYDMGVEMSKAKMIDNFFSMYGYAIKQTKTPNIRKDNVVLRPHWNFIKTSNCIIHSASGKGLPTDDEEAISQIYDNGITFWTNSNEVGNYSLDNSPTI